MNANKLNWAWNRCKNTKLSNNGDHEVFRKPTSSLRINWGDVEQTKISESIPARCLHPLRPSCPPVFAAPQYSRGLFGWPAKASLKVVNSVRFLPQKLLTIRKTLGRDTICILVFFWKTRPNKLIEFRAGVKNVTKSKHPLSNQFPSYRRFFNRQTFNRCPLTFCDWIGNNRATGRGFWALKLAPKEPK